MGNFPENNGCEGMGRHLPLRDAVKIRIVSDIFATKLN